MDGNSISLTLPVPPSANEYWEPKIQKFKGRYVPTIVTTKKAKQYKEDVGWILKGGIIQPMEGNVAINLSVYRPAKRGDLDNYQKVLLDSLEGFLYGNDRQIVELHAFRYDDPGNPRVEILGYPVDVH